MAERKRIAGKDGDESGVPLLPPPEPLPASSSDVIKQSLQTLSRLPLEIARSPARLRPRNTLRRPPIGSAPGVLHGTGSSEAPALDVIAWGEDAELEAFRAATVQEAFDALERTPFVWLNIRGNTHLETLESARQIFDLHSLAIEDAWNVPQRPKLDGYVRHLYLVLDRIVLKPSSAGGEPAVRTQQVSMFLGANYLITVQESAEMIFEPIRLRFLDNDGRMKLRTPDYLAYAVCDLIVDGCLPVVDAFAEQVEAAEATIYMRKHRGVITQLLRMRQHLHELRRLVVPMQAALRDFLHTDSPLVQKATRVYLRDCVDHATRLAELSEVAQDHAKSLLDVHIALSSHEMNEVMKVLTIISTIFIPLSFIAGVYGMNFDPEISRWNMPELSWVYGYPFALLLMLAVGIGFAMFFRARRWF